MRNVWVTGWVRTGVLALRPRVKSHVEDRGVNGRIILKWIFKKWDGEA